MDASFLPDDGRETIKEVFCMFEPEIEDVLWQISDKGQKEFEDELQGRFDMKGLKEIRVKIFRAALDKVDLCLSQVARARITNPDAIAIDDDIVHKADSLLRVLSPQDLVNRRCVNKIVVDISNLLLFVAQDKTKLPTDMIKSTTADAHLGRDLKQAVECMQKIIMLDACYMEVCPEEIQPVDDTSTVKSGALNDQEDDAAGVDVSSGSDDQEIEYMDSKNDMSEIDHDVIRALVGGVHIESQAVFNDNSDNEVNVDSIQDEIENLEDMKVTKEPICPLVVISETSPKVSSQKSPDRGRLINLSRDNKETPAGVHEINLHINRSVEVDEARWSDSSALPIVSPAGRESAHDEHVNVEDSDIIVTRHEVKPTLIVTIPPLDKTTSTADLWEYLKSSHDNPEVRTEAIDPILTGIGMMSGYDGRQSGARRKREAHKKGDACRECGTNLDEIYEWRDSMNRRVSNAVDSCTESVRNMRLMRDEVFDEMQNVKRRMFDFENNMKTSVTVPTIINNDLRRPAANFFSDQSTTDPVENGRMIERPIRSRERYEDTRRRASSFSGPVRNNQKQVRPIQEAKVANLNPVRHMEPPKEQRTQSHPRNARNERKNDNPIKDWLSSAKTRSGTAQNQCDTPNKTMTVPVSVSPSWADDCITDDEIDLSVDSSVPTPSTQGGAECSESENADSPEPRETVDIYKLPPSGQVTSTRPATCDAEADAMYSLPVKRQVAGNGRPREQKGAQENNKGSKQGLKDKTKGNDGTVNKNKNVQFLKDNQAPGKKGSNPNAKAGGGKKGKSYAKVASENQWNTVQYKKRKFEKVSPKPVFPLKGIAATAVKDVYLQGLKIEDGQTDEDILDSVRAFCIGNGVSPVYVSIIPVKTDCTRTGCRVTVKSEDFDKVMCESFWPDLISVREWTIRNKDKWLNDGDDGQEQSDDEN